MGMKIERLFTNPNAGPETDVMLTLREQVVPISIKDSDGGARIELPNFKTPEGWSVNAATIFADKFLRKSDVPSATKPVGEKGVPKFLQPQVPAPGATMGSETSVAQTMHRLAGTWTYHAWKGKYFATQADAKAFYDEMLFMLLNQYAAPNSPQFFNTGLHWAYGITGGPQGHYRADPKTGKAELTPTAYAFPQTSACFIQSISDDLVNEGGILDLVHREARLFKYGSGTGSNFSNLRGEGERLSGGGRSSGLMSFLRIGDTAAGSIKSGGTTRRAAKMVILDVDHPDVETFINWKAEEEMKVATMVAGSSLVARHAEEIAKIVKAGGEHATDIAANPALKKALRAAKRDGVPATALRAMILMAKEGIFDFKTPTFDTDWQGEAYRTVAGQNANNSVRLNAAFMKAVDADTDWVLTARTTKKATKTVKARQLWNTIAKAAWRSADPGLQFHDTINAWHTCKADGEIRASNPCSEYMFLDDTACNLASLNLLKFVDKEGAFQVDLYLHAIRLWTMVLDISVTMSQYPGRRVAERSHAYRTLGLGYANIGGLLMAAGMGYDSVEGRALCGALSALLTGGAYATSAEMASHLGVFPRYPANEHHMRVVINNHLAAAEDQPQDLLGFDDGVPKPVMLQKIENDFRPIKINALIDRARKVWSEVSGLSIAYGFRNAQVTVIAPTGTIGLAMGCDTTGIEPDYALLKFKKLAGGGSMNIVNEQVGPALKALGYNEADQKTILDWTQRKGTPEGCPALKVEHEAVFDCATRCTNGKVPGDPEAYSGTRYLSAEAHVTMMAAAQSFISGAISKTVNMPEDATIQEVEAIHRLAYNLGVKAVAVYRDSSKLSQPLSSTAAAEIGDEADDEIVVIKPPKKYPEKPPAIRIGHTVKLTIGDQKFYLSTGEYDDGRLCEVFISGMKEGGAQSAAFSMAARTFSIALQYGVPLSALLDQYLNTKAEPSGMVFDHPFIRSCLSPWDLIARHLGVYYLGRTDLAQEEVDMNHPSFNVLGAKRNGNGHANGHSNGHANGHASHVNGHSELPKPMALANGHAGDLDPATVSLARRAMIAAAARQEDAPLPAPAADVEYVASHAEVARLRGYAGEACTDCGNYSLVRNGTCLKCDTCGSTNGCS